MSKPGRNDPCPCGSGKKYKQCCMLKEKEGTKTYTPSGKRKFKATVLSSGGKSASLFPKVSQIASDPSSLKFRMTDKDYREKKEATPEEDLTFETEEKKPRKKKKAPHEPSETFEQTQEDFRVESDEFKND